MANRSLMSVISKKGKPAPLRAGLRWVVERTNLQHDAHKKLLWCTEREGWVIDFWIAFSNVVVIVRRLIRKSLDSLSLGKQTFRTTLTYWRKL